MARRNLHCLLLATVVLLVCVPEVPKTRFSRVLAGAMDHVSAYFFLPVDELHLFEGAMSGMLKELGDDYSRYINVADKADFEDDLNQEFVGIGIRPAIDPKTKQLLVLTPLPDGPAYAAGIRAGDIILKIEGQSTQGRPIEEAVERIHGKPGTLVTLTIQHRGAAQPIDLAIVRQIVHVDTVQGDARRPDRLWNFLLPGDRRIGYIRITGFAGEKPNEKGTAADFRAALEQLRKENFRGLVLDLRDNGGGSVRSAVDICDMLVSEGQIVTTRGREGRILEAFRASGRARYTDFPIVVLVNGKTASASEIVAACLQDHGRAIVAGQRSFGKGTVQEVIDMGYPFGAMKLTVATYWRPSGANINRPKVKAEASGDAGNDTWGVSPSHGYEVPVGDDERQRLLHWRQEHELAAISSAAIPPGKEVPDRVLQEAVEYLEAEAK